MDKTGIQPTRTPLMTDDIDPGDAVITYDGDSDTLLIHFSGRGVPGVSVAAAGGNRLGVTWVAGAGIEYALSNKWSVKGEYLALGNDLSNTASGPGLVQCPPGTPLGGCTLQTFNWRHDLPIVQTAKIGLNYKL